MTRHTFDPLRSALRCVTKTLFGSFSCDCRRTHRAISGTVSSPCFVKTHQLQFSVGNCGSVTAHARQCELSLPLCWQDGNQPISKLQHAVPLIVLLPHCVVAHLQQHLLKIELQPMVFFSSLHRTSDRFTNQIPSVAFSKESPFFAVTYLCTFCPLSVPSPLHSLTSRTYVSILVSHILFSNPCTKTNGQFASRTLFTDDCPPSPTANRWLPSEPKFSSSTIMNARSVELQPIFPAPCHA